jgi:outer membrane lipoprotein-sorting protein
VIRQPIPKAGANTPNLFAQFVDHPLERYRATYVGADTVDSEPVDVVRLAPRRPNMPFTQAELAIAKSDGWPRRLSLVEESGQRRVLVFQRPAVNQGVPSAELHFTVPKGTKVVSATGG